MFDILIDSVLDTLKDLLMIVPVLYLAYLLMEFLEEKANDRLLVRLKKAGRFGPLAGSLFGVIPECGFSAAAGSFYAGGLISAGTVLAVFLSTSDELIPIFLSEGTGEWKTLLLVLSAKVLWGIFIGYLVDIFWRKRHEESTDQIHTLCEKDHCGCEDEESGNIFKSALIHTLNISFWILITSVILNFLVGWIGVETIGRVITNIPVIGEMTAGLIGLIPNCAASVLLAELYLKGVISSACMFSGLLVSAGTGLLVLFRMNKNRRQSLVLALILYASGVVGGLLFGLIFG